MSDKDDDVVEEGEVDKEKVEKKKTQRKRQSTGEEPGSSKRPMVELLEFERRANLKKQKVLWGRAFNYEILQQPGMGKLVKIREF